MIGDRYSTDVLFGNLNDMLTIRTNQFTDKGEHWFSLYLQQWEHQLVQWLRQRRGYKAPSHKLF